MGCAPFDQTVGEFDRFDIFVSGHWFGDPGISGCNRISGKNCGILETIGYWSDVLLSESYQIADVVGVGKRLPVKQQE